MRTNTIFTEEYLAAAPRDQRHVRCWRVGAALNAHVVAHLATVGPTSHIWKLLQPAVELKLGTPIQVPRIEHSEGTTHTSRKQRTVKMYSYAADGGMRSHHEGRAVQSLLRLRAC